MGTDFNDSRGIYEGWVEVAVDSRGSVLEFPEIVIVRKTSGVNKS
jgi:hypothetical protein